MRKLAFLLFTLVALLPASASHIFVYDFPDTEAIPDFSVWTDDYVDGVSIRIRWKDFEPTSGVYVTGFLTGILSDAKANSKKVLLRILVQGSNAPAWVKSGAVLFSASDAETIWVYWDSSALSALAGVFQEIAKIAASYPGVINLVSCGCDSQGAGDWACPHTLLDRKEWGKLGYTSAKNISGCESYLTSAFSNLPAAASVYMAAGRNGKLDPDPNYVASSVASYELSKNQGTFFLGKNSWSAVTPDPSKAAGTSWEIMTDFPKATLGAQALWWVWGDAKYKDNGGKADSALNIMTKMMAKAHTWALSEIEVYEIDVRKLGATIQANN
ncbi:MAG TPA: hypothetical protein VK673_22000 [Chthoniobacterales bacterium]|nr:hypothetical protein [Chthoniobacterales bacterium]